MATDIHCTLCAGIQTSHFAIDSRRPYLRCATCGLVFVPPAYYLSRDAERAEYDLHQNNADDPGYRAFLSRLSQPLCERLSPGARGLDFGCGPAPALAQMMAAAGFEMALYDSFYASDTAPLAQQYDFVCATEVVEHLHHPGRELERLWSLLRPGGWLGVMTKLARDAEAFAKWHYKNDPTHVCFFSTRTWQWWAGRRGATVEIIGADVALFRKTPQDPSASIPA